MNVSAGKIAKYALLPRLLPRIYDFFASGFSYVSFYMAFAFSAARLLPSNHPYLNPENFGRFGIRHVMGEARKNLIYDRYHVDQVIIFYTMVLGIALFFMQFVMLAASLSIKTAAAGIGSYWATFFVTRDPANDITFNLLDRVFGLPGVFNSCVNPAIACTHEAFVNNGPSAEIWPTSFHYALHAFFNFYNIGILAVGFIVLLYFTVALVAETAQSGVPFGKRFNHAWAPVRLILAIGMLIPLPSGFSTAQMATLYVAKWGSGLASNTWALFNTQLIDSYTLAGDRGNLVFKPNEPQFNTFLEYMMVAHTCSWTERWMNKRDVTPIQVQGNNHWSAPTTFSEALANSKGNDIVIRYGIHSDEYTQHASNVRPLCGEVTFPVKNMREETGGYALQASYYDILQNMFYDMVFNWDGMKIAQRTLPVEQQEPGVVMPSTQHLHQAYIQYYDNMIKAAIVEARLRQINDARWQNDLIGLGWGGAGIWYNRIAEMNGSLAAAAFHLPTPSLYPEVMEHVWKQKQAADQNVFGRERFNPTLGGNRMVDFEKPADQYSALAMYTTQNFWSEQFVKQKGDFFSDTIIALFGLRGLYNLVDNVDVHPLAQLVGVGRSLVESAVTNLGFSFGTGIMGGIMNIAGQAQMGGAAMGGAGFMMQVAIIGLAMGFILAYIVPFMPFVYFFFAIGNWVKVLFETMIAMPMWAIGHVRIDGEGIPGRAAMNGYFMMLELFLRPVLVVTGLIMAVLLFAAQVKVLHAIWPLVTENVGGSSAASVASSSGAEAESFIEYIRDAVDSFFFMIIYTVIVYMIGLASFKLIDLLPNNIMRWLGSSVSGFSEYADDPASRLASQTYMGTQLVIGKVSGAASGIFKRPISGD